MADRDRGRKAPKITKEIQHLAKQGVRITPLGPMIVGSDDADVVTADRFLVYGTDTGIKIDVRYQGETLWMTQRQIADLFGRDVSVISRHIASVIEEEELPSEGNLQKMQIGSGSRSVTLYSLDMVISVGYRVSSKQATQFRMWATERLKEIVLKGWSIDTPRLKDADHSRIAELRDTIRDIRASEANVYREVRSICAMCRDYDPKSEAWRNFYAGMQNKMLWAVTQMTGAEIIMQRANADHPNMGLRTWPNENIRKNDVTVANNYLVEQEIREKNRFTTMLLDYFEDQLEQGRLVAMDEADNKLDEFIKFNKRPLLPHVGIVKRSAADAYAEAQYEIFAERRRLLRHDTW